MQKEGGYSVYSYAFMILFCIGALLPYVAKAQLFPQEERARKYVLDILDNKNPIPQQPAEEEKITEKKPTGLQRSLFQKPERIRIPIYAHNPALGRVEAPLQIIEFSDIGCTTCLDLYKALYALYSKYPEDILWIHKHAALNPFGVNNLAAFYGKIAQQHKLFWPFRARINTLKTHTEATLFKALEKVGLSVRNSRQLIRLYARDAYRELDADIAQNNQLRIEAPPLVIINGKPFIPEEGKDPISALNAFIEKEVKSLKKEQQDATKMRLENKG